MASSSNLLRGAQIAVCMLALQGIVSAQDAYTPSGYKRPKPDDSNQAATLAAAVLTLAPQTPDEAPSSQNQVAASMQSVTTSLVVSPATFSQALAYYPDLNQAISDVAASQVSPARQGHDPAKFRVVRKLVETLCSASVPLRSDALQTIYNNADQVSTQEQLNENEQLCSVIHAAMVKNGQASEYEYRRSATYKRIQRRRIYLNHYFVQP